MSERPRKESLARALACTAPTVRALRTTVAVAVLAAVSEAFRYVLLVLSLSGPVPAVPLVLSDVLVGVSGLALLLAGAVSTGWGLVWLVRARRAAAEGVGVRNARSELLVVLGVLVPGWNLFAPGTALAELEHMVLSGSDDRMLAQRPNPSLLLRAWWFTWVGNLVLGWIGIAWSVRGSTQAQADGVVLHVCIAVTAAVLALLTLRVLRHLRVLLAPDDQLRRRRVVRVRGAELPSRHIRPPSAPR